MRYFRCERCGDEFPVASVFIGKPSLCPECKMGRFFQDQSKLKEEDYRRADEYRDAVLKRTGLKAEELKCPREQSDITPCVARDGRLALAETIGGTPVCAGCDYFLSVLFIKEQNR